MRRKIRALAVALARYAATRGADNFAAGVVEVAKLVAAVAGYKVNGFSLESVLRYFGGWVLFGLGLQLGYFNINKAGTGGIFLTTLEGAKQACEEQ